MILRYTVVQIIMKVVVGIKAPQQMMMMFIGTETLVTQLVHESAEQ